MGIKNIVHILVVLTVAAFSQLLMATSDLPCVKEVCIGDGLDGLRDIEWYPVNYSAERLQRMRKSERARRARTYRDDGFSDNGAPSYLVLREFDGDVLDDMARVKVACEMNELVGAYISSGGNKTSVTVSLMPSRGGESMTWRVTGISRTFEGVDDRSQLVRIEKELNARYGKFSGRYEPGAVAYVFVPGHKSVMVLKQAWPSSLVFAHPSCQSSRLISVD